MQRAKRSRITAVCGLISLGLLAQPALADEAPAPFDMSNAHWSSPAGFAPPSAPVEPVAAAPPQAPVAPAAPVATAVKAGSTEIAAPKRALNMPVMPGVSSQFTLAISSTAAVAPAKPAAAPADADAPAISLAERNWQQAAEAARQAAIADADHSAGNGTEKPPLDVRLSFLPDTRRTAAPAVKQVEHQRPRVLPNLASTKKPEKAKDPAACSATAAIDQEQKRQLEALQGDRATLQALQGAITQLGLQKQLGYLAGVSADGAGQATQQASAGPAAQSQP